MKRQYKLLFAIMTLCLIFLCSITVMLVSKIQSYSKLVNYVGIIRGASQRLVKLEISGKPNNDMMSYLDLILEELTTGKGNIGLVQIENDVYNKDLAQLSAMWEDMKEQIIAVREGSAKADLIEASEKYFKLANETVFEAETYSNHQTKLLLFLILAMVASMIITWLFILRVYARKTMYLENTNQDLRNKIYTDALTGAPNLEQFQMQAQELLEQYPIIQFAIFYIDIDNFKYYNDAFGTSYGNEILQKYTQILKADRKKNEMFCRISADYFLVLRCYQQRGELIERQEAVNNKMAKYVLDTKEQHLFTLSYGICCREDLMEAEQIKAFVERANYARKTVKNQPLSRYAFYNESIRDKMLSEKAIENRMQSALENYEFKVFLQPKVELETSKVACAEALVRWIATDGIVILPSEFIPIFEKNMFIAKLDQFVMKEVCHWMRERLNEKEPVIPISVNVSRMQLYDPDFVKTYASIKNQYQIPDRMIEIEFTESIVFENLSMLLCIITSLKQEGFVCSLDDFGKGYSSLNLLRNLPVDVLKLDKLFFDEDEEKEKADLIVAGVISLVKKLNIRLVAEGVEKEQQVDFLREHGCDLIQGYVFYRPMPIEELEAILTKNLPAIPHTLG